MYVRTLSRHLSSSIGYTVFSQRAHVLLIFLRFLGYVPWSLYSRRAHCTTTSRAATALLLLLLLYSASVSSYPCSARSRDTGRYARSYVCPCVYNAGNGRATRLDSTRSRVLHVRDVCIYDALATRPNRLPLWITARNGDVYLKRVCCSCRRGNANAGKRASVFSESERLSLAAANYSRRSRCAFSLFLFSSSSPLFLPLAPLSRSIVVVRREFVSRKRDGKSCRAAAQAPAAPNHTTLSSSPDHKKPSSDSDGGAPRWCSYGCLVRAIAIT